MKASEERGFVNRDVWPFLIISSSFLGFPAIHRSISVLQGENLHLFERDRRSIGKP